MNRERQSPPEPVPANDYVRSLSERASRMPQASQKDYEEFKAAMDKCKTPEEELEVWNKFTDLFRDPNTPPPV